MSPASAVAGLSIGPSRLFAIWESAQRCRHKAPAQVIQERTGEGPPPGLRQRLQCAAREMRLEPVLEEMDDAAGGDGCIDHQVAMRLREPVPSTGHVQVASVPSRSAPDGEERDLAFLLVELGQLGYDDFIGCEYSPRGRTTDGLGWWKPYAALRK